MADNSGYQPMNMEVVADYRCVTGESPTWHPFERRLYWLDIPQGRMFRYDPATGRHEQCYQGDVVGGLTVQADGALLLFMAKGAVKTWREGKQETIISEIPGEGDSRFNDVQADPLGRVFCGTMSTAAHAGRLYRLDPDGTLALLVEGVGTSNGMGFTPDRKRMYHTDSRRREIALYDYDAGAGSIANRRLFAQVPEGEGVPDGLTVDRAGYVWSARWDGGCLVRYTPQGAEERRILFPARRVSSLTFGGDAYEDIYVTTAGDDDRDKHGESAGALFRLRPGIRGVPEFLSRIGL